MYFNSLSLDYGFYFFLRMNHFEKIKKKKFEFVFPSPQTEKELVCQNLEKEIAELGGMEYYLAYELNFVHPKHSA